MVKQEFLKIQKELARRELCRRRLVQFVVNTHPSYTPGWVHHDICARLERFSQQVVERKSPRLMLLCPPRMGKSQLASIHFPAWHLGHNPTHEIMNVGYNLELASKFSRKARELLRSPLYQGIFPKTQLDPESQGIEAWSTLMGGGYQAVGVGGGLTGRGAHILGIDDPMKNMEEADNADLREKLQEWYESTAYTRLAPGGGVLFIETFWNDDDLAGRLIKAMKTVPGADQFEIVKYPAIAEEYEYRSKKTFVLSRSPEPVESEDLELLRSPGEAVHPDRYPVEDLMRIKATLSPRIWSALYQQNPIPDEGAYFKREYFKYQITMPELDSRRVFTAWDFAIGEKTQNDWTVGATMLQDENDVLYVLEVYRMKGDSFAIVEAMLDAQTRWGSDPSSGYTIGVEDGQIWRAIKPLLERRMVERRQYPPLEVMKPLTDKIARARPLQGRMEAGRVVFPQNAAWVPQAVHELLRFPGGAHDDVVDAMAWAAHLSLRVSPIKRREKPKAVSWKDKLFSLTKQDGSAMSA